MIVPFPTIQPFGAAIWQKAQNLMDVILHIGAHRCASTSFQHYMRANSGLLQQGGIGFWGPLRTRSGLFRGIQPGPEIRLNRNLTGRAIGRVQLRCAQSANSGTRTLVVSDENMMGSMRANLRLAELYSGAGERMSRFGEAFNGYVTDVVLNIRSLETYWSSTLGYNASKGRGLPRAGLLTRLVNAPRSWRDVVTDIARAIPHARVRVLPFESFAGAPDAQLACLVQGPVPRNGALVHINPSPTLPELRAICDRADSNLPTVDGAWMPFCEADRAILRETYADDLFWLAGGADGLAELVEFPALYKTGEHLSQPDMTRGRHDDKRHRTVARSGRERAARQTG
ncbi:MAG: hypothetical protein WAO69_10300 [Aestuariivita sp.]|uniref:hypothetical protein n=1 Tax=Aestuariivita sp. TaxID=1872407 RepID=UPI003BB113CC